MVKLINLRWEKGAKPDEDGNYSESAYDSDSLVYSIYYDKKYSSLILEDLIDGIIYKVPDKAVAFTVAFKLHKLHTPNQDNSQNQQQNTVMLDGKNINISGKDEKNPNKRLTLNDVGNDDDGDGNVLITPIDELINKWKAGTNKEEIDREE